MSFLKGIFNSIGLIIAVFMAFALLVASVVGSALAFGKPLGYTPMFVLTGSMEPTIGVGALVITKRVPAKSLEPGQIITFPDPINGSRTLTHRIQHVGRNSEGQLSFITLGDANKQTERWALPENGTLGLYVLDVPAVGAGIRWVTGMPQRFIIFAALVFFIFIVGMRWAWGVARSEQIKRREAEAAENFRYEVDSEGRLHIIDIRDGSELNLDDSGEGDNQEATPPIESGDSNDDINLDKKNDINLDKKNQQVAREAPDLWRVDDE